MGRRTWPTGFALLLLCSGCFSAGSAPVSSSRHYVIGCEIYSEDRRFLRNFAGELCVFLGDGSFVQYLKDEQRLSRIGPQGEILWSTQAHLHHQLKLTRDGKRLITLGSDYREGDLCLVRYDDFLILDLATGKTIAKWSGYEHRKELFRVDGGSLLNAIEQDTWSKKSGTCEYTHFNSIDEIPENPTAERIPAFRAGNFVVSLVRLGSYGILDSRLEKLLWTAKPGRRYRNYHDVQVLKSGKALLYLNSQITRDQVLVEKGRLLLIDPATGNDEWEYPGKWSWNPYPVGTTDSGGVQEVEGGFLFNTNFEIGVGSVNYLIDRAGRKKWSWPTPVKGKDGGAVRTQDIKEFDLTEFLKNNRM